MKISKCKIICILLISILFNVKSFAQDSLNKEDYKFAIGAGAGFTTGYGLSFRYTPSKFGMQLNFAPYKNGTTERYSVGVSFLYKIIDGKSLNFFLYQANHYFYNSRLEYVYYPNYPYEEQLIQTDSYMNNGVGFGLEFIFAKRMSFNLMAGYAAYRNFKELNLTAETGLYFKF